MSDGEIDVFEELSGVAFEPTSGAGLGSLLGSVGSVVSPVAGIAGGLGSMFGGGGMDVSKAVSGGTFTTGQFGTSETVRTVIIVGFIVAAFFIFFKRKK